MTTTATLPRIASISAILPVFERACRAAYQGASYRGRKLDPQRIVRASLLLTVEDAPGKWQQYATTKTHCMCADWQRGHLCKHVTAMLINERALGNG